MTYELVINTASRRGRTHADHIIHTCHANGLKILRTHKITDPSRLQKVMRSIVKRQPDAVIVASGDGTVSEVIDELAGTAISLAIIPLGTTNNFARSLHLPLDIDSAVARIASGKRKMIDLGQVNDDLYANVAGIGISADVATTIDNVFKRRWGRLAYALQGLKVLVRHKPFEVYIADKDGELALHMQTHQLIIANGRMHAGTVIARDAKLDSRELVVFKLGGTMRLSFIMHMLDFYIGPRRSVRHGSYLIAKSIHIRTSTPQIIELDGEIKAKTPVDIQVIPDAIGVIC